MCNSQAEGGQRCHSHAKTALTAAETKFNAIAAQTEAFAAAGRTIPDDLAAKALQAGYDLADARARYASTPQGEADLINRINTLTTGSKTPTVTSTSNPTVEAHAYAEALSDGARLRDRAKAAHDGVRDGTMTPEQAADLTRHPNYETIGRRLSELSVYRDRTPAGMTPLEARRATLAQATAVTIASTANEVRGAVSLIAATVRDRYPNAQTVELEGSDQGDFLNVISIDGDDGLLYDLENDGAGDDLSWASSCIYDAHRDASPALHSANNQHLNRTDNLYINIQEALNNQ